MNKDRKFVVYKHTNKINGKSYVGQTCQSLSQRWRRGEGYKSSTYFYHAIQKYGWDNFEHTILECGLNENEVDERERFWIKYFNSTNENYGYNLSDGGNAEHSFNLQHKIHHQQAVSKALGVSVICLNTKKIYPTIRQAMFETGAEHISDCCKGKIKTSGKDKNGNALYWKYLSEYTGTEKIEIKKQLRKKTSVLCITTGKIYQSAKEAERKTGIDSGSIGRCCNGKRKTAGQCTWQWIEDKKDD